MEDLPGEVVDNSVREILLGVTYYTDSKDHASYDEKCEECKILWKPK